MTRDDAAGIARLWPDPDPRPLDDEDLARAYAVTGDASLRVNFVTTADGAVEVEGRSRGLSSDADRRVFGILRMLCDAVLVGAGTVRREGYHAVRLDERRRGWRTANGMSPYPRLVVVSRGLDLDPGQHAFAAAPVPPLVLTSPDAPADRRAALSRVAEVAAVGERDVDLAAGVALLRGAGLHHVLCEGGPQVLGALTAADLVDELCLSVAPMLAGAGAGRITAGPPSPPRSLSLRQVLAADGMLMLRYGR